MKRSRPRRRPLPKPPRTKKPKRLRMRRFRKKLKSTKRELEKRWRILCNRNRTLPEKRSLKLPNHLQLEERHSKS